MKCGNVTSTSKRGPMITAQGARKNWEFIIGQINVSFYTQAKVLAPFQSRIYCTFICNCYILDICHIVARMHMYISFSYMHIGWSVVNMSTSIMGMFLLCLLKTLLGLLLTLFKFSTLGALLAS